METILRKLTSRKFLATLGAAIAKVLVPELPDEALVLVGTYVAGESIADAAGALRRAEKEAREAVEAVKDAARTVGVI